jgi:hypothetical protein
MVEAIFMISVFILFFLGMVYFRSMYEQKLRVSQLARSAAVGYALGGCKDSNPLSLVSKDLGSASNNGSNANGQGNSSQNQSANVGTSGNGGDPLSGSMSDTGVAGDKIAQIAISGPAAGTTKSSPWAQSIGFRAKVGTSSFMSCGEERQDGSVGGAFKYVGSMFKW